LLFCGMNAELRYDPSHTLRPFFWLTRCELIEELGRWPAATSILAGHPLRTGALEMNAVSAGPGMRQLTIRQFAADDRKSWLAMFDGNIPRGMEMERLLVCARS